MIIARIVAVAIGYVCGLFETGYFYGKKKGVDIRTKGSGNSGATNTLRTFGWKAGLVTCLGDILKTVAAVLAVKLIFGRTYTENIILLELYAGFGAVLGHNFPFYLNFKGGKGIAATAGLLLSFDLRLTLVAAIVFLAAFFLTHYVSLGSLLVYVVFVAGIIIMGQTGQFAGMGQANIYEMYVLAILLAILAYYKHWPNILRLIHGNENKTYLKKKKA